MWPKSVFIFLHVYAFYLYRLLLIFPDRVQMSTPEAISTSQGRVSSTYSMFPEYLVHTFTCLTEIHVINSLNACFSHQFPAGNDGVLVCSNSMSRHRSTVAATVVHFVQYFNLSREASGKCNVLKNTIFSSVGRKLCPLHLLVMYRAY